jgi:hypothetical protein
MERQGMTKDKPCLRIVDRVSQRRRLESRREIEAWVRERSAALQALMRDREEGQLRFDERAA